MAEQEQDAVRVFWRIVRTDPPTLEDFKTQKERGRPAPDTENSEAWFSWEHGVSVQNTKQQALNKARDMRGMLGGYVVGVQVEADGPLRYLKTLGRGHFDLIGAPADMLARVLLPVDDALAEPPPPADR